MIDDIDKTWLFLDNQIKDKWILIDEIGISNKERFISLVCSCIDFGYQCNFDQYPNPNKIYIFSNDIVTK
jgi:hypothetical protein